MRRELRCFELASPQVLFYPITLRRFICALLSVLSALVSLTDAQKAQPSNSIQKTYQQGLTALQRGDLSTARTAFETVVNAAPNSPEGHNSLGWVLANQGQLDQAIVHYQTALKL